LSLASFDTWLTASKATLIWVTGYSGCGKTTLSAFIARHLQNTPSISANVCIYFCDDKIRTQKDANSILIGLIFQIIVRHRSLIQYVRKEYQVLGQNLTQSFTTLWKLFVRLIADSSLGSSFIILDALDECEAKTRRMLLDSIGEFVQEQQKESSRAAEKHIKFFLTSRPGLNHALGRTLTEAPQIRIGQEGGGYGDDLRLFIRQRLDEISEKHNCSADLRKSIEAVLTAKADHTFLWVHIILSSLEDSLLNSKDDFLTVIDTIPTDLRTTYKRFLGMIPTQSQNAAFVLLKLILGSPRPLHLDEINVAFSIKPRHSNTRDVTDSCQNAIERTIQGILGPFVRISDSHVSLVHQSAKEFLISPDSADERQLGYPIALQQAALALATACIQYLLLDDFTQDIFAPYDSSVESSPVSYQDSPRAEDFGAPLGLWGDSVQDLINDLMFQDTRTLNTLSCTRIAEKYSFYRYAATHWTEHFALCEAIAPPDLFEGAMSLLDAGSCTCSNWTRYVRAGSSEDGGVPFDELSALDLAACFGLREALIEIRKVQTVDQRSLERALFWASSQGHSQCVEYLLSENLNTNNSHVDGQPPLVAAAKNGHIDCVTLLLRKDQTSVNARDTRGRTALSMACGNGHAPVVDFLLAISDCAVNEQDNQGSTPLMWAVGGDFTTIVSSLLQDDRVDPNARDKMGRTATSWAAGYGYEQSLQLLIRSKAVDLNVGDNEGKSPLIWAVNHDRAACVSLLVRRKTGVDKGIIDKDGRNAISWASGRGHVEVLLTLIKYGCPGVTAKDVDGWNPLAWAIQNNSPRTVEVLLSTGKFDIDERDQRGKTALWWSVEYGQINNVVVLLQEGANPTIADVDGISAEDMAKSRGRSDIVEKLRFYIDRQIGGR
jgi:ankyrin repeat domain-containing protein 50